MKKQTLRSLLTVGFCAAATASPAAIAMELETQPPQAIARETPLSEGASNAFVGDDADSSGKEPQRLHPYLGTPDFQNMQGFRSEFDFDSEEDFFKIDLRELKIQALARAAISGGC